MPAVAPAVRRIKYLVRGGTYTGSPDTISGNSAAVYSYAKCIASLERDGWKIVTPDYSNTTRRHVRAAYIAFSDLGIPYTVVDYYTGEPVKQAS